MRAILMCNKRTSIGLMLETLELLSVKQKVNESTMKFIFKLRNGQLPRYLSEMVTYNGDVHAYPARSLENFRAEIQKTKRARNSLFNKGLVQCNLLPSDVKFEKNEIVFKQKLRQYVKNNL